MVYRGVDVSARSGKIDWQAVATDSIRFAIIRAGVGEQKDTRFEINYNAAVASGLPVGVYWEGRSCNCDASRAEAEACLRVLNNRKLDLPLYYQWDETSRNLAIRKGQDLSRAKMQWIGVEFAERIAGEGYIPGFAFGAELFQLYIRNGNFRGRGVQRFVNHHQWCRTPGERPPSSTDFGLWTQTKTGRVLGIPSRASIDVLYSTYLLGRFLHPEYSSVRPVFRRGKRYLAETYLKMRAEPVLDSKLIKLDDLWPTMKFSCITGIDGEAIFKKGYRYPAKQVKQTDEGTFIQIPCGAWLLAWNAKTGRRNMA
ncbi:MAG: GH25 family lysozyme [Eubacteriales bacterium]|nr:GH25 family lysozyme [Eubacteriales bacterium]